MAKQRDLLVRLLMIGDSGVGKTCLICRFCDESFDSGHSTVGKSINQSINQSINRSAWTSVYHLRNIQELLDPETGL